QIADRPAQRHPPILDLVLLVQDIYKTVIEVGADRAVVDQHHVPRLAHDQLQMHEQAGCQASLRIVELGSYANGAGTGIERVVDEIDTPTKRERPGGFEAHAHQRAAVRALAVTNT